MAAALEKHQNGDENFKTTILVSEPNKPVTRQDLIDHIADLYAKPSRSDLVFYFSGHGDRTALGAELRTYERPDGEETGPRTGVSMDQVAAAANRAKFGSLTIILDCCYAGAAGEFVPDGGNSFGQVQLARGVALMAASRGYAPAFAGTATSKFTTSILEGLNGAAADLHGRVTPAGLHALGDASLAVFGQQQPELKIYSSSSTVLRQCVPEIGVNELRHLVAIFGDEVENPPTPNRPLTYALSDQANVNGEVLAIRSFVGAGLIRATKNPAPDGQPTAPPTVSLSLTPRGLHYWRIGIDGI